MGLGRRFATRVVMGSWLLASLVVVAVALHGCGSSDGGHADSGSSTSEPVAIATPAEPAVDAQAAAVTAEGSASEAQASALPPEIALEEMNTTVVPGQAVTVRVEATPDVTEILLSDGIGDPQALVRHASGDNTWEVDYRVPLRPREERIGISLTARNESKRWHRIWLFLQVQPAADLVKVEEDSLARP